MARTKKTGTAIALPSIPWGEAIKRGKNCVAKAGDIQWELGELAARIEPKYGDKTLEKFANELGANPATLANYRTVFKAFPEKSLRSENSFYVCQLFAAQKDRFDLVARKKWTGAQALAFVQRRLEDKRKDRDDNDDGDDGDDGGEDNNKIETPEDWAARFIHQNKQIIEAAKNQTHELNHRSDELFPVVNKTMINLVIKAAEAWSELASILQRKEVK